MAFTQEQLEEAYAQMIKERKYDVEMAMKAAEELTKRSSVSILSERCRTFPDGFTPFSDKFNLVTCLCQYDNWKSIMKMLELAGVKWEPWNGEYVVRGQIDLGSLPELKNHHQTVFEVRIDYYNSHHGGF